VSLRCPRVGPFGALSLGLGLACGAQDEGSGTTAAGTEVGESSSSGGSAAETRGGSATTTDAGTTGASAMTGSTEASATVGGSTTGADGSTGPATATDTDGTTEGSGGSTTVATGAGGADSDGSTGGSGDGPSFAAEIFPLIALHCACHKVSYPDAETTFAGFVDQPSMGVPELTLVVPYDVEGSYLLHKLRDTQLEVGGLGAQMPPKKPLSPEELELFDLWVSEGAAP